MGRREVQKAIEDAESFGALLREAMADAGLTQRQAAKAMGVSQSKVSEWSNGKAQPEASSTVARVAAFLGVDCRVLQDRLEDWRGDVDPPLTPTTVAQLRAYIKATEDAIQREVRKALREQERRLDRKVAAELKSYRLRDAESLERAEMLIRWLEDVATALGVELPEKE